MRLIDRNKDVRQAKIGIPNWMIAERLGVSEQTVLRWYRTEMNPSRKTQIMKIIAELQAEW